MTLRKSLPPLAALLLVSCSHAEQERAAAPLPVIQQRLTMVPARRVDTPLVRVMLDTHRAARAAVGEAPLVWNEQLARDAAAYAAQMARTGRFAHSTYRGSPVQGENLWMGTHRAYSLPEMASHWVAEKRYFKRGPTPYFSTTGSFEDVGHYTQIIWRRTTQLGCAIATNGSDDYLVCRYLPAGNVWGHDPLKL